ncbi:Ig-like domain-containing protein [Thalassococcus sp. BH17M4-6]|uniref:Ig-like domain-containing protein n=1 Tax=Thalassococcus sp. BH17M4-6 TaxID=3413148 RepID=UPI003BBE886F
MNAIEFVTRTRAGATSYGSVGGQGQDFVIPATAGEEISINLRQSDLRGYDRAGDDLLITLADGRVIVIEGYFVAAGEEANRLFLSADGELAEVSFQAAEGGTLYASYGPTETWGKWSPSDDLIFVNRPDVVADLGPTGDDDVSMLAAGLLGTTGLGALGAAGGAALVGAGLIGVVGGSDGGGGNGGVGGDNGNGDPVVPTILTPDDSIVIGGNDDPIITVSGTGEPTSDVAVTIGDETQTTTVDDDGNWTVEFEDENFPADGDYVVEADVTAPDGTETDLTGPSITIDTTPPLIDIEAGTESVGDIVNAEDHADGATVSGTVEPGATVVVAVGGVIYDATVDADGGWTVTFDDTVLPGGEYSEAVTITATDAAGNSTVVSDVIEIDTVPHPITIDPVGGDNLVNGADADAGFEITGTSTAGAVVSVVFGEMTHEVTTGADGVWTVLVSSADFTGGEYSATITASTVDAAGNASATSSEVVIDTVGAVTLDGPAVQGDDIINAEEHAAGTTFSGTTQPGSVVTVTVEGTTLDATVTADGTWSVTFGPGDIAAGTYATQVVVNATDAAGNSSSTTHSFDVDTEISGAIDDGIAGDGLINAGEAAAGIAITGTAEAGASVTVTFQSTEYTTTATDAGTWSVSVPTTGIAEGVYDATVTMQATDAAGNVQVAETTAQVDTTASVSFDAGAVGGDGTVNAVEHAAGVTLTGTALAGSTVTVAIAGQTYAASVTADGAWSVDLGPADLPTGTTEVSATVTAVSQAGNTATTSGTFQIDTEGSVAFDAVPVEGDDVVNAAELADGVTLTGISEPGSSVDVSIGGVTHAATVAASGSWSVTFAADEIPSGTQTVEATATATDAAGNVTSATDSFAVDTETSVTVDTDGVEGDGIVNDAERADGVTLTGMAEPGASVMVQMGTAVRPATVAADGSWTATFAVNEVPSGETAVDVTATATDAAGNTSSASGSVDVDTLVRNFAIDTTPGGADGVINAAEAAQGLTLSGTTEPGASVTLTLDGTSRPATVAADGSWTVTFPAAEVPTGEQSVILTASSTDAAGNTEELSQSVTIDTDAGTLTISPDPVEGDDIVNAAERADGVTLTGTSDPGQMVDVMLDGVTRTVQTDSAGIWRATYAAGEITPGTHEAQITATITDGAGNTLTRTDSVRVDTEVLNFGVSAEPVEGDGVVNADEAANGLVLSGTTEPGASVTVTFEGTTRVATVDAQGNWTASFTAAEIPPGQYDATAQVDTTDAAGNTASTSTGFRVDTEVDRLAMSDDPVTADNVVNAAEAAQGLTLTGVVEAGSNVQLTIGGVAHTAAVDAAGNWTVDIPASSTPSGTVDAPVLIEATDAAGNTRSESATIAIDTDAPTTVNAESYTRDHTGLRGITIATTDYAVEVGHVVDSSGTVTVDPVSFEAYDLPALGETSLAFTQNVPDGSHLVITATDTAGNSSGTYLVVDDTTTSVVDMTAAGTLGQFQIETIDLQFAEDSQLTITEAQLLALSSNSDTVTVEGGVDDMVTITGATLTGTTQGDNGEGYNVYELGQGTLLIDDEITNVVI